MNQSSNLRQLQILRLIRERRESLFYSQEYLAAKLDISQKCYSKLEIATIRMTVHRFLKICDVLELDPSKILDGYNQWE